MQLMQVTQHVDWM